MQHLFVDTGDIDDRVNNLNRAMKAPLSDGEYVLGKLSRLNHPIFSGTGYYRTVNTNVRNAIELCNRAKKLMAVIDKAGESYKECEKILKKFFDDFDLCSVALENEIRADLGLDSINTVDGQIKENLAKVAVGVAVVTIGAVCTVASGGTLAAFMIPAVVGAGTGTVFGGVNAYLSGEDVIDGMADGFMKGSISGTISGVINAQAIDGVAKCVVKIGGEVVSSVYETGADYMFGDHVTGEELLSNIGNAFIGGVIGEYADLKTQQLLPNVSIFTTNKKIASILKHRNIIPEGLKTITRTTVKTTIETTMKSSFCDNYNDSPTSVQNDFSKSYLSDTFEYFLLPSK